MLGIINRQLTITPRLNQILQKEGLICDHQRKEELYLEVVHLIWKSESSSPMDLNKVVISTLLNSSEFG